jgi:HD-GYP domain-containing protein (c-di-GMP phosphodiesterase class II)
MLKFMERIFTILPTLESLYYFKQYDNYTYLHILKVFALSTLLSQTLVENYQNLIRESMSGPIHDLGKICIPLKILKKTNPLTRTERGIIEHHTSAGYVLLSYYLKDSDSFLAKVAKEHHERRDGSGYPLGISVTDQMLEIIMVSDIYDALISTRPYRGTAYDNRTALEELTRMAAEGKLEWDAVKALVACNRSTKPHYKECIVSTEERGKSPKDNRYGIINEEGS